MNSETEFEVRFLLDINQLNGHNTAEFIQRQFSWRVETCIMLSRNGIQYVGIFLRCTAQEPCSSDWSCIATAKFRMMSPHAPTNYREKPAYFMEFSPEMNRRGYERFVHLKDLRHFVHNNQIMIHIKIRAVALSKANSLVNLTTILPTKDGLLKLQVNFRDIQTIFGAISPEFQHNDTRFNVCIFKRPIEAKGKIEQDAVWFYLCCRSEPDQRLKWAYRIILMTKNDDIAPLTAYYEDIVFSKEKDSCGAPFVLLSELNNTRNQYVLASGAMTIELSLSATRNTQPLRKKISGLTQRYIKTEPQSPQIYSDPLNNQQLLPNANIKQERCDSPPLICVRETPCVTPSSEPSTSNSSGGQAIGHSEEDIATLKCILCSNSLFDDDVYATKCGHLYCQDCFRKDIMYRKMCLKCDVFFTKIQCRKVYLNAEHEKNCRFKHIATRSDSLASSFADTVTQEAEIQHLNCPLCDINLLTVETSVTLCGHLYCKKCLDTDIGKRGMCIVCNKKDSYDWTPINFP